MRAWQEVTYRIVVSIGILFTLFMSAVIGFNEDSLADALLAFIIFGSICGLLAVLVRWILRGFRQSARSDSDEE